VVSFLPLSLPPLALPFLPPTSSPCRQLPFFFFYRVFCPQLVFSLLLNALLACPFGLLVSISFDVSLFDVFIRPQNLLLGFARLLAVASFPSEVCNCSFLSLAGHFFMEWCFSYIAQGGFLKCSEILGSPPEAGRNFPLFPFF